MFMTFSELIFTPEPLIIFPVTASKITISPTVEIVVEDVTSPSILS